jgi:5-dehydro-4-deoxyglucarate dehydratase
VRSPQALRAAIDGGLLSFPLTDFTSDDTFDAGAYRARLDWLETYGAQGVFAAGGAGEYFSLQPAEYEAVIATAVAWSDGGVPVIAAAGMGTHAAVAHAQAAEAIGADGILMLPPYMTEASQEGLLAHIEAVCRSVSLGVIVYNRGNCRLAPATVAHLAELCPNLIAVKDGIGNVEWLLTVRSLLGDRLLYINGMPTAEVYAPAYAAMGAPTYSSAIFNFIPQTAVAFHRAVTLGDRATCDDIFRRFFAPYIVIRNRQPGYAVSIVKAGADIVGRSAGHVRPPLSALTQAERADLAALIAAIEPWAPVGSASRVDEKLNA